MVVGHDVAVSRYDDTRAGALLLRCAVLSLLLAAVATVGIAEESERVTEEIAERVALHLHGLHLAVACVEYVYDRRQRLLCRISEVYGLSWYGGSSACCVHLNERSGRECNRCDAHRANQVVRILFHIVRLF